MLFDHAPMSLDDDLARYLAAHRQSHVGDRPPVPPVANIARASSEPVSFVNPDCRRERSLKYCHLPAEPRKQRHPSPRDTGAYIPEMGTRVENDLNLTDGARR